MRSTFGTAISANGQELFVTLSGGMCFYPENGGDPEDLLRHADAALYEAKDAGGDRLISYTASMSVDSSSRLDKQNALHRALDRNEFRLHFQPIVDTAKRRLVGLEALIRWQHPKLGLVPPNDFIPLAVQTGLIVPIGDWVLRTACKAAMHWPSDSEQRPWIAVNVSARQFAEGGLSESVSNALRESGLHASRLVIEVTESDVIRDLRLGAETLRQLSKMGVGIAIDDFGTGYSSLSYLRSYSFDTLKIDRSFVQGLPANTDAGYITRGIIALGHALGMKVVAEGVETEAQAAFLNAEHCDKIQGFLISRPVAEDALPELFTKLGAVK
jgi:EAL domain-containing protein (putative c-di-GMP-specific phosphodiesterase class I)